MTLAYGEDSPRRYPLPDSLVSGLKDQEIADLMGVVRRTVCRWRDHGMNQDAAERLAEVFGEHPFVLWPELRDRAIAAVSLICAAGDCDGTFVRQSSQSRQLFCSNTCARRQKQRRYRAAHPEQQEKDRERARRYHSETPRYQRVRRQRWKAMQGSTDVSRGKMAA